VARLGLDLRVVEPAHIEELADRHRRIEVRGTDEPPLARELGWGDRSPPSERVRGGAAATIIRQRRNGTEAIVAERSGPGCGPSAMSARRVIEQVRERLAGDGLDRDLDALVPGAERLDQRTDVLGDEACGGHEHLPRLTG
jgi:hypothetical protein